MKQTKTRKWSVYPPIPDDIDQALNEFPKGLRQLLFNRKISDPENAKQFLEAEGSLYDPFRLKDMNKSIERIQQAIEKKEKIIIYGDYDADGICSSALMIELLSSFNADVAAYIPDRFEEGYGLNKEALTAIAENGTNLVITVDCGIRAVDETAHARNLGMDMIISDHHEPGDVLPDVFAIINPKQPEDTYPEKNLAGVGIAFKIAQALVSKIGKVELDSNRWLDLAAVGTIADIVPLQHENRAIVRAGLKQIRSTNRVGLRALIGAAGISQESLSARDIGFMIGPRLNAAGRLDSAHIALELLLSKDPIEASHLAQQLDNLNRKRQNMINDLVKEAEDIIVDKETPNLALAVSENFHQGVVGLVASKICDRYYRPTIIGQKKGDFTVASCRSIESFHITNALDQCSDLFERYGGHAMAAGFTIKNEKLVELENRLDEITKTELDDDSLIPHLEADMEINLHQIPANILEALARLEPTGSENPDVKFISRNTKVINIKRMGANKQHLSMILKDKQKTYKAVAFFQGDRDIKLFDEIDILFSIQSNTYNGYTSTQLILKDIKKTEA